jgi:glycosyltransferase involved in cell wall biosynthesis
MSAPRVLVSGVVLGQPMGGVRRHNAELLPRVARLLAAHGGSLAVLEGREPIAFALPPEIERIRCDVPSRPVLARARHEGAALRAAIDRSVKEGRPFDLVHTAHLPAPRGLAVPYTITIHDLRRLDALDSTLVRWPSWTAGIAIRRAIRGAAAVIAVSESVRADIRARFRVPPERAGIVRNAADHFAPLPRQLSANAPILCVGHLERRKNIDVVLRALSIDRELPRLALAGAPKANEEERLRRLASRLGVADRVEFLGPFDDRELASLYAHAGCVVLPSRIEGFGISALEAQRARAPLAIAVIPPLVEVASSATPSFAPEDERACANAIRRALAATSADLDRAEANARRYSWDASARAWFEIWCAAAG